MKFFHFRQNNSGGSFDIDETRGLTVNVIIEATDAAHANALAETKGIYFNGCDTGMDCKCCGDRWYPAWGDDGEDEPSVYNTPVKDYTPGKMRWTPEGRDVAVHYYDGRIEWF